MAEKTSTETLYRPREAFSFDVGSRQYLMRPSDIVNAKHPAFKGREHLFEEITPEQVQERKARSSVGATETASAAPGQQRVRTQPPRTVADAPQA